MFHHYLKQSVVLMVLAGLALGASGARAEDIKPTIVSMKLHGRTIHVRFRMAPGYNDKIHLRWGRIGREEQTAEWQGNDEGMLKGYDFDIKDVELNTDYIFKVQGVKASGLTFFGTDYCTPWVEKVISTSPTKPKPPHHHHYLVAGIVNQTNQTIHLESPVSKHKVTLKPHEHHVFSKHSDNSESEVNQTIQVRFWGKDDPRGSKAQSSHLHGNWQEKQDWHHSRQYEIYDSKDAKRILLRPKL